MVRKIYAVHERKELTGVGTPIIVFQSDNNEAFSFGFFKPRIAISKKYFEVLTSDESEALLRHESHHVIRRDPLKFFVLDIVRYTFFFLPLFRNLITLYRTAAELASDENAENKDALGRALLKLNVRTFDSTRFATASFASALSERIEKIIHPSHKTNFVVHGKILLTSCFLFVLVVGALLQGENPKNREEACRKEIQKNSCSNVYNSHNL